MKKRKFQVVSDLHLSAGTYQIDHETTIYDLLTPKEEVDGLIFAGDLAPIMHLAHNESRIESLSEFLEGVCKCEGKSQFFKDTYDWLSSYKKVIYVAGNHEYYSSSYHSDGLTIETMDKIANRILPPNVEYVGDKNRVIEYMGVTFICSTLWAEGSQKSHEIQFIKSMLNDFILIPQFDYDKMIRLFYRNVEWIKNVLSIRSSQAILEKSQSPDYIDRTIVVTHHTPSPKSIHPRFAKSEANGAFTSNLEYLIERHPEIDYWIHGHTHDSFDYEVGHTRVICNPRGYQYNRGVENEEFEMIKIIEI